MKKVGIFLLAILFNFFTFNSLYSGNAKITIILTDKSDVPLSNLNFNIYNSKGEIVEEAFTDSLGVYKSNLPKGDEYKIQFDKDDKEWRFNLSVPDKPGPRSYKYSFKVFVKAHREIVYKAKTEFEKNVKSDLCDATVRLRDDSGMPLPNQPLIIYCSDINFKMEVETDLEGTYRVELKQGYSYDIQTEIEGYKFNSLLNIPRQLDLVTFNFDIDFQKIAKKTIDTAKFTIEDKFLDSVNTIIRVVDMEGKLVEDAMVVLEESNVRLISEKTDETGEVATVAQREKVYELYVRKYGKTFKYEITFPKDKSIKDFTYVAKVNFEFNPLRTFKLNINFDTNKYNLRKEDVPEMESLYKLMSENPKMIIEIGGHTDWVGSEESNQILSENRAKTCVQFLVERGIDISRMTYRGYGESSPIATNKTASGRFLNRRTEVSVLAE